MKCEAYKIDPYATLILRAARLLANGNITIHDVDGWFLEGIEETRWIAILMGPRVTPDSEIVPAPEAVQA